MENKPVDTYIVRDFYGPLEKRSDLARREDIEFHNHPTDTTKLVRFEQGGFVNSDEMRRAVMDMHELLSGMTNHDVTHVNPQYFDATYPNDKRPVLGMVVDKLHSHSTFKQLFENGRQFSDEELYEVDKAISAICNYVADVEQSGGIIAHDVLTPHQFVYVPDSELGRRFVSVDVEPVALERIEPGKRPRHLTTLFVELFEDIIKVKSVHPRVVLSCEAAVMRMIKAIPSSMPDRQELQDALVEAWNNETTERLGDYIDANAEEADI